MRIRAFQMIRRRFEEHLYALTPDSPIIAALVLVGIVIAHVPVSAASVASVTVAHSYAAFVTEAAQRFGISERWIWTVMHAESRGDPRAVSPAGAMGVMQIMPATWAMLARRFGLGGDAFDVRANIHAGAAYLRMMWDRYGNVSAMLAAYNAGPGRTDAWIARGNRLPAETVAYVAKVAPAIGDGNAIPNVVGDIATPSSWRNASMFAARTESASDRVPSAADQPSARASTDVSNAESSRVSRPANPLFVPLSGGNRP